jgi:hypothetical protein
MGASMRRIGSTPRPGSSCPAPPAEQPLEVLTAGNEERLDVHFPEGAEAEAAESMPVLCLTEQGLDPHRALPHRLVIGSRLVITVHSSTISLARIGTQDDAVDIAAVVAGPVDHFVGRLLVFICAVRHDHRCALAERLKRRAQPAQLRFRVDVDGVADDDVEIEI